MSPCALEPNSLDLVRGKPLFRSVIELCRPRTLVCRHFLSVLERSAVGEVGGDAGSPECVTANFLGDARRRGSARPFGRRIATRLIVQNIAVPVGVLAGDDAIALYRPHKADRIVAEVNKRRR